MKSEKFFFLRDVNFILMSRKSVDISWWKGKNWRRIFLYT